MKSSRDIIKESKDKIAKVLSEAKSKTIPASSKPAKPKVKAIRLADWFSSKEGQEVSSSGFEQLDETDAEMLITKFIGDVSDRDWSWDFCGLIFELAPNQPESVLKSEMNGHVNFRKDRFIAIHCWEAMGLGGSMEVDVDFFPSPMSAKSYLLKALAEVRKDVEAQDEERRREEGEEDEDDDYEE